MSDEWLENLPPDIPRENLRRFNDPSDLARSYLNMAKEFPKRVKLPAEGDRAGLGELYERLGLELPETPRGYETNGDALLEKMREAAFEAGVPKQAWSRLSEVVGGYREGESAKAQEIREKLTESAKSKLGERYDEVMGVVDRTLSKIYDDAPEIAERLKGLGVVEQEAVRDLLVRIGGIMGDDSAPDLLGAGSASGMGADPHALAKRASEIGQGEAYRSVTAPGHDAAVDEFYAIQRKLVELGYNGSEDDRLKKAMADPLLGV